MKLAAIALVSLTSVATAAPFAPPAGWTQRASTTGGVTVYGSPTGRVTLVVATSRQPVNGDPAAASTTVLAELHALALHDPAIPDVLVETGWVVTPDNQHHQTEALLHYSGRVATGTVAFKVAADATHVVGAFADCSARGESPYGVVLPCLDAQRSLDTGIPESTRLWAPPAASRDAAEPIQLGATLGSAVPTMAPIVLPPPEPVRRPIDRRPMYLGAIVLLFALFSWWNRRRRADFDDEALAMRRRRPRRGPDLAVTEDPHD